MHAYVHTRIRTRGRDCVLHARVAAVGTTCLPVSPASSPTRPLLHPSSPCLHASLLPCLSAPASLPSLPPSIPRCQTVTEGSFRELEKKALRAFFLLPTPPLPPGLPSPLPPFPPASLTPCLPLFPPFRVVLLCEQSCVVYVLRGGARCLSTVWPSVERAREHLCVCQREGEAWSTCICWCVCDSMRMCAALSLHGSVCVCVRLCVSVFVCV